MPHTADLFCVNSRVGDDDSRVVWSSKTSWLVLKEELGGAQVTTELAGFTTMLGRNHYRVG